MKLKTIRNNFLIIGTVVMTVVYLVWRIIYTIPLKNGLISLISAVILLFVEILGMFEAAVHYYNMSDITYPNKPHVDKDMYPHIDIFIATYNEPVKLLFKTINGCNSLDYPDKSKIHIYLCDDGNREEMKKLAASMNINYLTRTDRKGLKAGNLNNALSNSNSPLIVTFDADMIPMHDFLMATVPYFLTEEKIGFVQTPQSFYNPDLFQYYLFSEGRIPNEQDYFYRDVQLSKNKSNSVIYGGTNTVIARKALEEVGGFYTKAITEDFATGMLIQSKGYRCYAIDEIHASGLAPGDLPSLIKQRERWSRGCIQTGRRLNILFNKNLKLSQKLSYISSISYWYAGIKRLVYIMAPIMFSVFGVMVVNCNLIQILIFWLPMYLLSSSSLKRLSRNIRTTKWTNIYETILFPYLIIPVLLETIGISQNKFAVTRKDGANDDISYRLRKAIPHMIFALLSIIGIANCIRMIFDSGSPAYSVVLFWLIINFYNILMSLFFMLGREAFRRSERFFLEEPCTISFNGRSIECTTIDISEGGTAVMLDFPEYIPSSDKVQLSIRTERYSCEFYGYIVHICKLKNKRKYAFKLAEIDEKNYKEFLKIIYDRLPSLPKNLDKNSSIFDDIRVNLITRNKKKFLFSRKLPRIEVNETLLTDECGKVKLSSFNYEYIVLSSIDEKELKDKLTLHVSEDKYLECILDKTIDYDSKSLSYLYKIKNDETLKYDDGFKNLLSSWIEKAIKNTEVLYKTKKIIADEFNEMNYL